MAEMFDLQMPWWQIVLRATLVYVLLLAMLRLGGKRSAGEFTPFDIVFLVLLGEAMQSSLIGAELSVLAGLIAAATLVALHWLIAFVSARSKRLERVLEGAPVLLAEGGRIFEDQLRRQNVSRADFDEAMREARCPSPSEIQYALLENDGRILVMRRQDVAGKEN